MEITPDQEGAGVGLSIPDSSQASAVGEIVFRTSQDEPPARTEQEVEEPEKDIVSPRTPGRSQAGFRQRRMSASSADPSPRERRGSESGRDSRTNDPTKQNYRRRRTSLADGLGAGFLWRLGSGSGSSNGPAVENVDDTRAADFLIEAIEEGKLNHLHKLLSDGVNPRDYGTKGDTALHTAAICGDLAAVECILDIRHERWDAGHENKKHANMNARSMDEKRLPRELGEKELLLELRKKKDLKTETKEAVDKDEGAHGKTPLHLAVLGGHKDIVKLLIKQGARVDEHDNDGRHCEPPRGGTAMHYAVIGGDMQILEMVLKEATEGEKKCSVSIPDAMGNTPLHLAVAAGKQRKGHAKSREEETDEERAERKARQLAQDMTMLLLEKGADVNFKLNWGDIYGPPPSSGRTPLHVCDDHDIAHILLAWGAVRSAVVADNKGMTPLHHCAVTGNHKVAAEIIMKLVEALLHEANRGDLIAMREDLKLILWGKDWEREQKAKKKNNKDKDTEEETQFDTPPCIGKCTLLCGRDGVFGKERFHVTPARFITRYILYQDDQYSVGNHLGGQAACHTASFWGHSDFYEKIAMELKADEYKEVRDVLIKYNNDLVRDYEGRTRLHHAAMGGCAAEVRHLVKKRPNVNFDDKSGKTPLHYAAIWDHVEVIEILLEAKAIPDVCDRGFVSTAHTHDGDRDGWSPLHHAARKGNVSAIETLIRLGAERNIKSEDADGGFGITPLEVAKQFKWNHSKQEHHLTKQALRGTLSRAVSSCCVQ